MLRPRLENWKRFSHRKRKRFGKAVFILDKELHRNRKRFVKAVVILDKELHRNRKRFVKTR